MSSMTQPRTISNTISLTVLDLYICPHLWSDFNIYTQIAHQRTFTHFTNEYVVTLWHSDLIRDSQTSPRSASSRKHFLKSLRLCTYQACLSCWLRKATLLLYWSSSHTWPSYSVIGIYSWSGIMFECSITRLKQFFLWALKRRNT